MEKQYKTQKQRIELLKNRGMDISDEYQENILKKYNHYSLINAYKSPFLEDKGNYPDEADKSEDYFIKGTSPEYLEALYNFDKTLRLIFLERILNIEEKLKDSIVQAFYDTHTKNGTNKELVGILHRENEYLRRIYYNREILKIYVIREKSGSVYTSKEKINFASDTMRARPSMRIYANDDIYDDTITMIYSSIAKHRKKKKFISKYFDEHTYLPMWVLMNILTFGNVSKFYNIQKEEVKIDIFKKLGLKLSEDNELDMINLSRVIEILGIYRNITAHNERFYCTSFSIPIDDYFENYLEKLPHSERVKELKDSSKHLDKRRYEKLLRTRKSIYTLMFCISIFMSEEELEEFKNDVSNELFKLEKIVPKRSYDFILRQMGLNFNWEEKLIK